MPTQSTNIKIHGIAFYFAHISQDLREIAEATGVGERQIRRYAETKEWQHALDVFGYTGDRNFATQPTRDTVRDAGEIFEKARQVYLEAMHNGQPKHKLARITADAFGLTPKRVRTWAQKYGWRQGDTQLTGGIDA